MSQTAKRFALLLLMVAASDVLMAQSFDCKLAKSPVETAICSNKQLSAADTALAATYKSVLSKVPVDVQAEVRGDQRRWLRGVNATCGKADAAIVSCLKSEYKAQQTALEKRVATLGGVTFVVRSLELTAKDAPDDPWKKQPELEENPGFGTLDATWPQAVSYPPDQAAAWQLWNAEVVRKTKLSILGDQAKASAAWDSRFALGADNVVTATVVYVGPQVVSTSISVDGMSHGAAHPFEVEHSFHWLIQQKRELTVDDVFAPNSAWEKLVASACRASLKEQIGNDYQDYAGPGPNGFAKVLHHTITDLTNWDLDSIGFTINFPEYSVAPRAEPVDNVTVSWSALAPYLAKGFVIPK